MLILQHEVPPQLARVATYKLMADSGTATKERRLSICAIMASYRLHVLEFPW